RVRFLDVEAARTRRFDHRPAERQDAVCNAERREPVPVALEDVAGIQLDELDFVRQPPDHSFEGAEQVDEPARAIDGERQLPASQRKGLEHPRQAEDVVGVEMGDEHLLQLEQPDGGAQQLPLRALGAVEEELVAPATNEQRRRGPLRGRHRAGCAEEDEIEIHGPILGFGLSSEASAGPIAAWRTYVFFSGSRGLAWLGGSPLPDAAARLP